MYHYQVNHYGLSYCSAASMQVRIFPTAMQCDYYLYGQMRNKEERSAQITSKLVYRLLFSKIFNTFRASLKGRSMYEYSSRELWHR